MFSMIENQIHGLNWHDVGGILSRGGTVIGTARSPAFRTLDGRRRAAMNLIKCGITGLICVGGDGSLTGADLLLNEWPTHVAALRAAGTVSDNECLRCPALHLVGFTGTIGN